MIKDFGLPTGEICVDKFCELSNLVSCVQCGDLDHARKWLLGNKERLGSLASQLEFSLIKLDFLLAVQQKSPDLGAILGLARQLAPFAATYSSDFERLMGCLVFLGRDLVDTPYSEFSFPSSAQKPVDGCSYSVPELCMDDDCEDFNQSTAESSSAPPDDNVKHSDVLVQVADLFRACYCQQFNLSNVDPLCTVFNSGCHLLSKPHNLQRAISCLNKYTNIDGDTLPVAVEMDPVAHRHNIFHCPVIKEVSTSSNGPVRLSCGHAVSRDAFESLPSGDHR
ncbi:unnamed protein product [Dicrocoelium dendriticum]|nr:unnamed protein product [Dicrocoelium dendriticum]